jgi:hypothetical protein
VSLNALRERWIEDAPVLYIGKAGNLRRRLGEYMRFGAGTPCGHWGGRYIWQVADSARLLIAWTPTSAQAPRTVERQLLADFRERFGALPFANLRR